jgi:RNA polymerase-binding transcription factor DksA
MNTTTTTAPKAPAPGLRYSAEELAEFEILLKDKLTRAEEDLRFALDSLMRDNSNGTDDTYSGAHNLEDGTASLEREELMMLAARQDKFIKELRQAIGRIRAGTYGICKQSGELISKERLRLVPHATMSVAAKQLGAPPANAA